MDKIQTAQHPEIRNYLIQKLKNQEPLNLTELAIQFNLKNQRNILELISFIRSTEIELTKNKRFPYDINFNNIKIEPRKSKLIDVPKLIELFEIFLFTNPNFRWRTFEQAVGKDILSLSLWQTIRKLNLSSLDLKLFFRTIQGFFSGQHPIYINDLKLDTEETILTHIKCTDEKFKLAFHDLVRVQTDVDGVSSRLTITQKTLKMLDYRCKAPDDSESNLSKDKLYKTIHYRSIKEHSLFYSSNTQKFHLDITQIAKKIDKSEGICILLSGASGTGKTLFANQLAKEIKGTILQLSFPQIQSKYIGETEKNIQLAFEAYNSRWTRQKSPTILLLNEADGLMNKRVDIKTSNDIFSNHAQTELLEQLENFKGILIATTNMANNMDSAFKRRFLFQMEIKHPDSITREKYLLQSKLRKYLTQKQIKELSETHWTIAEIQKIEKQMELISRIRTVDKSDLTNLLTQEGHYANKYLKIGYR